MVQVDASEIKANLEAAEVINVSSVSNVSNLSNLSSASNGSNSSDQEAVGQRNHSLDDLEEADDEQSAEDSRRDVSNLDPDAVRLRWRTFPDQCLIAYGNTSTEEYTWTIWKCRPTEEAWFRQRYLLPRPGEPGRIKSQIGKVAPGDNEYCLTVPACVVGTLVAWRPCAPENIHNTFTISEYSDGTVRIRSPKCPANHCIDVPDANATTGNYAQIWPCFNDKLNVDSLLKKDEVYSVGISQNTMKVFDSMSLHSEGGPHNCEPDRVSKALGHGLQAFEVRCQVSLAGNPLHFSFRPKEGEEENLGHYASIWSLYCIGTTCECKARKPGEDFTEVPRLERSLSCGVLMLSTHPLDGECPADLKNLEAELTKSGEVDCVAGRKAVKDLQLHPNTAHRLDLRYVQAKIDGLNPEDFKAFSSVVVRNSSGPCNATNITTEEEARANFEAFEVKCPSDKAGKFLGMEIVELEGGNNTNNTNDTIDSGAAIWSLWCMEDVCTCKPVVMGEELYSASLKQGEEGCGVVMLSTNSKFGSCPKTLKRLQNTIEVDEEVDCEAGREEAARLSADPENAVLMKMKWVDIDREESSITKVTQQALNIFSVIGGAVVLGTVPAWPAVAKFAQFIVMMASNHAELGLPDEFSDFAHKFTKFDEMVKPLKKMPIPGLKDLGMQMNFMASSKWFILKDKLANQTMQMVLRVYTASGMISPGLGCFLSHYYDPVRQNLRDVKDVLETNGGTDPCDYSADEDDEGEDAGEDEGAAAAESRRLAEDSDVMQADGGSAASSIRQKWAKFQTAFKKQIDFLQKTLTYGKKEFSVTKNLLFCLLVLPMMILIYCFVYLILWMTGSKYSYIPTLHPLFLLIFMADLVLLNILMAWANVIWRRRLLQCENPFILMDQVLGEWNGMSADEPITSAIFAVASCFRPIISLLALIPPMHVNIFQSRSIANFIFIVGPCLIFLIWFLHFLCSKIVRHPHSNHFVDEDCSYIKGKLPVMGFFRTEVFYEQPQVSEIKRVIAKDADGLALYKDGKVQAKMEAPSKLEQVCGEVKAFFCSCCFDKKKKKFEEGVELPVKSDPELAGNMEDDNLEFTWAFRLKGLDVNYRGLPNEVTLAFETTHALDIAKAIPPHLRLRIARGNQVISLAFQARSEDPNSPFPAIKELEPNARREEKQQARRMALATEMLQSTWRRRLLEKIKDMLSSKNVEVGYLRWTMWDCKEGWTVAAFNLELIRPDAIKDDDFVKLGNDVKDMVLNGFKSFGPEVLQAGWREASALVEPCRQTCESIYGPVEEAFRWRKLAEASAKKSLKAEELEGAFVEVDARNVQISLESPPKDKDKDKDGEHREEEQQAVQGSIGYKQQEEKEEKPSAGPSAEPKASHEFDADAEGFLSNISAATSFQDEHLVPLKVEPVMHDLEDKELPALALTSDLFRSAKRGDIVEIWIAGQEAENGEDAQASDPMIAENTWKKALECATCARFIAAPINAWDDPEDPFEEVAVVRKKQEMNQTWLEAIRRFPEAFVGKVQVPIKLQAGFGVDLDVKVCSRDLLHLDDQVPIKVPFGHLQLAERDRWRVFYLNDHQKKKSESPQLLKMINGMNLFMMVIAVVLIPRLMATSDPGKDKAKADEWKGACPKGVETCNPDAEEFQDMTKQMDRQTAILTGVSAAMVALAGILLVKVFVNSYHDGDVKPNCNACRNAWAAIKSEFNHLIRIFKRETREMVTVEDLNFVKLVGDIKIQEAFSRALKKSVKGAQAEEVHVEMAPGSDDAIVYAQVPSGFPKNAAPSVTLGGQKRVSVMGNDTEPSFNIKLRLMDQGNDKSDHQGCKPPGEGDGVSRLLAMHGGDKSAGWFNSLKEAAKTTMGAVGLGEKKSDMVVYAYSVEGASFSDLHAMGGGHVDSLKQALADAGEVELAKVKAVELTCNSIQGILTYPNSYKIALDKVGDNIMAEKELKKVMTAYAVSSPQNTESASGRCPSWFGLSFVLGLLKLLLIIFMGLLTLANGGTMLQALCAVLFGLFLWFLSRLLFSHMVEGSVFKSSTMEIGQVGLLVLPLILQMNLLEPITCSAMMIIGVLWALVTICCKYLRDKIKKYEKEITKFVSKHTKQIKDYTSKYKKLSDFQWFYDIVEKLLEFKLRFLHALSVYWHAFSANTRDPAWLWSMICGILFFLCFVAVAALQSMALTQLSSHVKGSDTEKNRARVLREIPGLLLIFTFTLVLLGLAYMVFMKWLPEYLQKRRDAELFEQHEELTKVTREAVWIDKDAAQKDEQMQHQVMRELIERSRAYPEKDAPPASETEEAASGDGAAGYRVMTVEGGKRSVLFDPLNCAVPLSAVPIFADDGASVLDGNLRLQSGALPLKRLLCTEWAWSSPRYLVERTPLQVHIDYFKKTGEGTVPPDSKDEPVPDVGLSSKMKTYSSMEVLICTLQVINFVGLTLGKTDRHDGILCLWRSPDLNPEDQLVKWFEEVRRFFTDYGASFEKGSRVYPVLECLFWGIRDMGDEGAPSGEILQEHKRGHMVANDGKPYRNWLDSSMSDLVRRLGPNRPKPGEEDEEEVSDDEQEYLEQEKKGDMESTLSTPRGAKGAEPTTTKAKEQKASKSFCGGTKDLDMSKGALVLVIGSASSLPVPEGSSTYCKCVVNTPHVQNCQTAVASDASSPEWRHEELFENYEPGKTKISFTLLTDSDSQVATVDLTLTQKELSGGQWVDKDLDLVTDGSGKKGGGCCACACGSSAVEPGASRPKLSVRAAWTNEDDEVPARDKFKRPGAAQGFCGGPLAWSLLHPVASPQLLHVAVAAEDLRVCPQRPRPQPFSKPPVLGRRGAEPPVRGTRALGREPGRQAEPEEPFEPSCKPFVPPPADEKPPNLKEATDNLDSSKKDKLKQILARKQVKVDEKAGTIVFLKAVEFIPRVQSRDAPNAEFKRKEDAASSCNDAAAVLQVYDTAKVAVEGHLPTKDQEPDDYAQSLATSRAQKVLDLLVQKGVDRSRLSAVGKPGKLGTGKQEVVLKVTQI